MSLDILKALTTSEGNGTIIPAVLDPMLVELADKETPVRMLIPRIKWTTNSYQWNVRSALSTSAFYNETSTFSGTNSTYARRTATIAMMKQEGTVSQLLIDSSGGYIDALQAEIEGATKSLAQKEELALIMANYGGVGGGYYDANGFDGIAHQIADAGKDVDANGASLGSAAGLNAVDTAISEIQSVGGKPNLILCSPTDLMALNQYMRDKMTYNWERVDQLLGTVVSYYQGIRVLPSQFIPSGLAYETTPTTTSSIVLVLDTNTICVPVLRSLTYEDVIASTTDGKSFRIKQYLTVAVKAREKNRIITNIVS